MDNLPDKLRALAASGRTANVPSVAGNVFLGIALANLVPIGISDHAIIPATSLLLASGISLYLAGNFFNDWFDRNWDAAHRPERGLPQRLFSPATYLTIACAFFLLGLGCAAAVHPRCFGIASAIGVCVFIYTWLHKRTAWAVIPMGLCRALLPLLGFSGFSHTLSLTVLAAATGLFFYIVALSLSARCESMSPTPTGHLRFARLWFLPAALLMFLAAWKGLSCPLPASAIGVLPYALWIALCLTIFRKPVPLHVSNLLAGIPLVDWIILLPLGLSNPQSGLLFTACIVIPPLAFLSGKSLQRLTPAT